MKGLDYSWSRPGGAAIKAASFEFVMRYVPYAGDGGKGLTAGELADLRANGLAVGLVWETTAGRAMEGEMGGREDAAIASEAAAGLGFPADRPIYFAVDFDAQSDQFAALDNYLSGCASVLGAGRVGVYGSYAVVEHCHEAGSAVWYWQTYAWSGGRKSDWRHVYQYQNGQMLNNAAVDYNEAYGDDFGQWKAEGEEDMTPEQLNQAIGTFIGQTFPEYLEAYFAGGFTERNGVVSELNPEGKNPIKPWLPDIEAARCRHTTLPGVARD